MFHNGIKILMLRFTRIIRYTRDIVEGLTDTPNALSLSLKRLHHEHIHVNYNKSFM